MKKIYLIIAAFIVASSVNAQTYLSKDFNDTLVTSGGWTNNIVVGLDDWYGSSFGADVFAKVTNYNGAGNDASEVWMISPSFDLSTSSTPMLSFRTASNYAGADIAILVSTNYDGTSAPATATWATLTATLSTGSWTWAPSGNIDLSLYKGVNTYVAFQYTGTTTDGKTWEVDDILVIETSTGPSISATATAATCGSSDGTTTVVVNAGTTPYTYLWNNNATSATITGLSAGTYTVTVTDGGGSSTTSTVVGYSNGPTVTITTTDALCNGNNDGTAVVSAGGLSSYTYAWSNGQTGPSVSALTAGTYTYTVTDATACFSTGAVTISEPTAIAITATTANETVLGAANGSATASATGGNGTYTYLWQDGTASAALTNVVAGTYTVTVTDGNGCSATANIMVGSNYLAMTSIYDIQYTSAANGDSPYDAIQVMTKGVVSGFCTYDHPSASKNYRGYFIQDGDSAWSGLYVNDTVNYNLVAPGDTVIVVGTVRDNDYPYWGYTTLREITSFTLAGSGVEPTAVPVTTMEANAEKWEGVLVSTTNVVVTDVTSIAFGAWSIDDNSGATITDNLMHWQTPDPVLGEVYDVTGVMFSEFNDIMIEPRKPSDVTFISVSVTPPSPVVSVSVTTPSTCGSSDGVATVTATNGTAPYTYLWSNGSTAATASGLAQGTHYVTVTDATPLSTVGSVIISNSNGPVVSITGVDVSCFGNTDGAATATGGTSSSTYAWDNGTTTSSTSGLSAGAHTCTVTDGGCSTIEVFTIGGPSAITITGTAIVLESGVGTADGAATAVATGGSGNGYTYLWETGANTATLAGVVTGSYAVTATDGSGCSTSTSIMIGTMVLTITPISKIQYTAAANGDSPYDGMEMMTKGVVSGFCTYDHPSASRNYRGYFIQDGDSAWSGLFVNDTVNYNLVAAGDTVIVVGTIQENDYPYWGYTVLRQVTSFALAGSGPEPTAVPLTTVEVAQEKWEGVLVSISSAVVTDVTSITFGSWSVDDNSGVANVDNLMYWHSPDPQLNEIYNVTGVMFSEFNDIMIEPRRPSDVTFMGISIGMEENTTSSTKIYPNPSTGIIIIEAKGLNTLVISNAMGQVVSTTTINGRTKVDLSNQYKGIYFVRLQSENSTIVEKVVIK